MVPLREGSDISDDHGSAAYIEGKRLSEAPSQGDGGSMTADALRVRLWRTLRGGSMWRLCMPVRQPCPEIEALVAYGFGSAPLGGSRRSHRD